MNLIAQEGYYKGKIIDGGLGVSSGGFPQVVFSLIAEEIYDAESDQYVPADPESNQINYYGVLFDSKDKHTGTNTTNNTRRVVLNINYYEL